MSIEQNIGNIEKGLKKTDEVVENLKTLEKLWKWIKRLSKLVRR